MKNYDNLFDKNGHLTDLYVCICSDRLREDRDDLIPDEVLSHLEGCEQCRNSVLDIFSSILTSEKNIKPEETPFSSMEPVEKPFSYRLVLRTAATFMIMGFVAAVYLLMNNKEPVNIRLADRNANLIAAATESKTIKEEITPGTDNWKISAPSNKKNSTSVHDPFKDNLNLEYMVNSHHRGRLIHIISPEFKIMEKGKIVFMWENHIDKNIYLKILNNLNETLFKFKAEGSRVEFKGDLAPGLYYWKLEDSENLYHVGKFLIEK